MKKWIRSIPVILALVVLGVGCSSTTLIQSSPEKAKVYLDGVLVGETPYRHTDARIIGTSLTVRLEKEGYDPLVRIITKDEKINVGAVISGLVVAVPLFWSMEYEAEHTYELKPETVEVEAPPAIQTVPRNSWSKADKLRELKQLMDEGVITREEFEKEKAKVLERKE